MTFRAFAFVVLACVPLAGAMSCAAESVDTRTPVDPLIDGGRRRTTDSAPAEGGSTFDPTSCPQEKPTWTPPMPNPVLGSKPCSADDFDFWRQLIARSFDEQREEMTKRAPVCAKCMFHEEGDESWGPLVKTRDGRTYVPYAACMKLRGASATCVTQYHAYDWCVQAVCNVCKTGMSPSECEDFATPGPCYTQAPASCETFRGACDSPANTVETWCVQ